MNDDNRELEFVRKQLQSAVPPWNDQELQSDLWPRMLHRMEEVSPPPFGWVESILVALVVLTFAFFPELLPAMLYHL